jgi:hypothetical protein
MPRTQITRDDRELGFETGRVPAITEQQFRWLSFRMGCDDDLEPCRIMELDPLKLRDWLENPDFIEVYGKITENKREAFKYLITQLNGKALRVINDLLDETSVSARVNGLNLLLRAEGSVNRQNAHRRYRLHHALDASLEYPLHRGASPGATQCQ